MEEFSWTMRMILIKPEMDIHPLHGDK